MKFKVGYPPWGLPGYIYTEKRPLFYDFRDFANYFVYQGSILAGAQTYDKEGYLLAEASFSYYVTEEGKQGIEIDETHYGLDGKLVFKRKSQIDPYEGLKQRKKKRLVENSMIITPNGLLEGDL